MTSSEPSLAKAGARRLADDIILATTGLCRSFRGIVAVDGVDLQGAARHHPCADRPERRRQDHLLQPADQVPAADAAAASPSTGATSRAPAPADVARLGLVRSFQISAVFPHLTVLENVRIALQRKRGDNFDFWRSERVLRRYDADAFGADRRRSGSRASRTRAPPTSPMAASARSNSPRRWRSTPS